MRHGRRVINSANYGLNEQSNVREWKEEGKEKRGQGMEECPYWVPHPRTGIYYPLGYERVMEGIPNGAASFGRPYWLRNSEGVEKPASDDTGTDLFDHPFLNV